jgi:hypothetical protein
MQLWVLTRLRDRARPLSGGAEAGRERRTRHALAALFAGELHRCRSGGNPAGAYEPKVRSTIRLSRRSTPPKDKQVKGAPKQK